MVLTTAPSITRGAMSLDPVVSRWRGNVGWAGAAGPLHASAATVVSLTVYTPTHRYPAALRTVSAIRRARLVRVSGSAAIAATAATRSAAAASSTCLWSGAVVAA